MLVLFWISGVVAVLATVRMLTGLDAVHALLYLTVSLLAVAVVLYTLGAPFMAALEVIVYAGAIMVLFLFVMMLLNLGRQAVDLERSWVRPRMFVGPGLLAAVLVGEVAYLLARVGTRVPAAGAIGPRQVAMTLYGPYLLGVELASFLLLGALVGAYRVGVRRSKEEESGGNGPDRVCAAAGGDPVRAGSDRPAGTA